MRLKTILQKPPILGLQKSYTKRWFPIELKLNLSCMLRFILVNLIHFSVLPFKKYLYSVILIVALVLHFTAY